MDEWLEERGVETYGIDLWWIWKGWKDIWLRAVALIVEY